MYKRRNKHAHSIDFELNLASIIDCFTVLITYLLMATSFIAFGALSTGVSIFGPSEEAPATEIEVVMTIKAQTSGRIHLVTTGKDKRDVLFQPGQYAQLAAEVAQVKNAFPGLKSATLTAEDDVDYLVLVKIVESLKNQVSVSILGGYTGTEVSGGGSS